MWEKALCSQKEIQSSRCFILIQAEVVDKVAIVVEMELANQGTSNKIKI